MHTKMHKTSKHCSMSLTPQHNKHANCFRVPTSTTNTCSMTYPSPYPITPTEGLNFAGDVVSLTLFASRFLDALRIRIRSGSMKLFRISDIAAEQKIR